MTPARMRRALGAGIASLGLALAALGATAQPSFSQSAGGLVFTDWTSAQGTVATGTLLGHTITLSGWHVSDVPYSIVDGSSPLFAGPYFTPPLPRSDAVEFRAENAAAHSYTLSLGAPTTDPVLHLGSLGTTLEFPPGTSITRVSGKDAGFAVSSNIVSGAGNSEVDPYGENDSNGTVRLNGTFESISFTATTAYNLDGIVIQVGATPPPTPTPTPTATATATPVERNVSPPTISFVSRTATGATYRCNPGSWEGLSTNPQFSYTWYRAGSLSGTIASPREVPTVQVGTGPTHAVPQADYGREFYCVVEVRAPSGQTLRAWSATTMLNGVVDARHELIVTSFYGNMRIRGIDVFQIVQPRSGATMFGWPNRPFAPLCGGGTPTAYVTCAPTPADPHRAAYQGVPLDQGKPAAARVFVDMDGLPPSDAAQPLDVTLSGRVDGTPLPGAMTTQIANPLVSVTPWVSAAERSKNGFAVTFGLPAAWLAAATRAGGTLDLDATVAIPVGADGGRLRECPLLVTGVNCAADNRYRLDGVPVFDDLPALTVKSLRLLPTQDGADLKSPSSVLHEATKVFPAGERMIVQPYSDTVSIRDAVNLRSDSVECDPYEKAGRPADTVARKCKKAYVNADLDTWWRTHPNDRTGYDVLMAVHHYMVNPPNPASEPGWKRGDTTIATPGEIPTIVVNDGSIGQPLTAAAHELGHALGLPHADSDFVFGGIFGGAASGCGGNSDGEVGEPWLPDGQGRIQGVGFVRRPRLGSFTWSWRVDADASPVFDFMSYCASSDATAWLSPRNWNRTFAELRAFAARHASRAARLAAAGTGRGFVVGVAGPSGARIARVVQAEAGTLAPAAVPSSPLQVRALDAAGRLLGTVGADVEPIHHDEDAATFAAPIPDGTVAVELWSGAGMLDRAQRSHPPTVRVTAPRRGTRVGAHGRLDVRWTARDADGDALYASIDYAADGHTWRNVFSGPSTGRATIPASYLTRGVRGRVRVTVDDGFTRASAVSAPLRAAGRPPTVQIAVPAEGSVSPRALLTGDAADELGRRLPGRALTWFAGHRRLGTGERLTAVLPAGRVALRLVARDAAGRTATATRRLTVQPPDLLLLALAAPERVGAAATVVRVRVATTVAAVLRIRGHRFAVGTRSRVLRLPLPARPYSGVLRVAVSVSARDSRSPTLRRTLLVLRA